LATIKAPTVIADPKTTNTAIFAMLLIADSPWRKATTAALFAPLGIISPYPTNQLAQCYKIVKWSDNQAKICPKV
jgi:hypothetical protein